MCYGKQFAFSLARSSANITRGYFPEMFSILAPVAYKLVFSLPGQTTVHIMRLKLFESADSEALAQVIATQSKSRQLSQCLILSRGALCQAMLCTRCDHSNKIY